MEYDKFVPRKPVKRNTPEPMIVEKHGHKTGGGCDVTRGPGRVPYWVTLALNETNVRPLKISFSIFWLNQPKSTETDLKKSQICPN